MSPRLFRYVATETVISIMINATMSALFMELVFGRSSQITLWGPRGLAVDFIPQTLAISAMSVIVPTLITRRRLRMRVICPLQRPFLPAGLASLWRRVALVSVALVVGAGGLATCILSAQSSEAWTFWTVFPYKIVYGAAVALLATPIGLIMVLSESPVGSTDAQP